MHEPERFSVTPKMNSILNKSHRDRPNDGRVGGLYVFHLASHHARHCLWSLPGVVTPDFLREMTPIPTQQTVMTTHDVCGKTST
jgi:hypothetical protein